MTIAVLILGAGAASRMRGGDKLLETVEGKPLLRLLAERALATGAAVAVTLPPDAPERAEVLKGLGVTQIEVPDAATGMSASLRRGAAELSDLSAMIVLPGDMPEIETSDIKALITAFADDGADPILRAMTADGRPGHPVLFPGRLLREFAGLTGDEGAAKILKAHAEAVRLVALPGARAATDLDTPEDWAAWRARHVDG